MVDQGMPALGYKFVTLDDCWSATARNASGHLQPEPSAFPHGMKALADYVHSRGLYIGLYTCVGTVTCKGKRPGSFGFYERDAQTMAEWGIDLVKMDHCGFPHGFTDQELYTNMSKALNATGRPIVFSMCSWGEANVWEWGADVSQMFRVQQDHLPFWHLPTTGSGTGSGQGVLDIIDYMAALQPSNWTKRAGWLDPDFLMTLYSPTMSFTSSRTEITFWTLWSAPLLVATDIREMSAEKKGLLLNPDVIAIDQDNSATAGDRIRRDQSGGQVWARPLANGDKAVVLFNAANLRSNSIAVAWSEIGWPGARAHVYDLWARCELGSFEGGFNSTVKPHDVVYLRLSPAR